MKTRVKNETFKTLLLAIEQYTHLSLLIDEIACR